MSELNVTNRTVEGDLVLNLGGIQPDRSFRGRLRVAWAVLRGQSIGRSVIITGCWIGQNIVIDYEPFMTAAVAEIEKDSE